MTGFTKFIVFNLSEKVDHYGWRAGYDARDAGCTGAAKAYVKAANLAPGVYTLGVLVIGPDQEVGAQKIVRAMVPQPISLPPATITTVSEGI